MRLTIKVTQSQTDGKSTLVRVRGGVGIFGDGVCILMISNSQFLNYHYFSNSRGIKPKLTSWLIQPSSIHRWSQKKSWLLFRGDLWSHDLLLKTIYTKVGTRALWQITRSSMHWIHSEPQILKLNYVFSYPTSQHRLPKNIKERADTHYYAIGIIWLGLYIR